MSDKDNTKSNIRKQINLPASKQTRMFLFVKSLYIF